MKILAVCQYYYPEPFRVTDVCEELVRRGHEVTVVTGIPNYPMGKIYDEYKHGKKRHETINGVKVHRCFTIGRGSGAIMRFLNYFSYAASSSLYVRKLKEKFDVVLVNQLSPVMMASAGIKYKKKHKVPLLLYCLDLWPESLLAGGVKKDSLVYKIFDKISKKMYTQADRILITSRLFKKYLVEKFGIKAEAIEYLPQYAEAMFSDEKCTKEADGYTDLLFAGNIGSAQRVDTIIKAAAETKSNKNIRWHILGDGSDLENCKKLAQSYELDNVIFYGRKPLEEMPEYYKKADAMLVTLQSDAVISLTLPGKVQSYMAAEKPIIAAIDGETAEVVKASECGWVCEAENYKELAALALKFEENRNLHKVFAQNSKRYYEQNFSREIFFDKLEEELRNYYVL